MFVDVEALDLRFKRGSGYAEFLAAPERPEMRPRVFFNTGSIISFSWSCISDDSATGGVLVAISQPAANVQ
jgi:hypothetical protein